MNVYWELRSLRTIAKWCASVAAVLVVAACGLFVDEAELLTRAQEAQKRGDLRAASIDLKSLLQKDPANVEARFALGVVTLDGGDPTAAAREFERLRTEGFAPDRLAEPQTRAYQSLREFDKALQVLNEVIAKGDAAPESKDVPYRRMRGDVYLAKGQFKEARTDFEASLAAHPDDVRAMIGVVAVAEATEGTDAALTAAEGTVAKVPAEPLAHIAHGGLLLKAKRAPEAEAAFQKAVELSNDPANRPELISALAGLTQAQLAGGNVAEALKTSERMVQIAPNMPLVRYIRAYALAQNNELDAARALLEQNVATGVDLRSQMLLGAVNFTLGRYAQAEMQLSAVVAGAPDNAEARQILAQVRLRQAKPADALDALLPAIANDKTASANMVALAGQASLAAGKTKEGVALFKRNAEAHPENASAQLDLAAGYIAAGQSDLALAILGSSKVDESSANPTGPQSEEQLVRREYLAVVAKAQKGDMAGATDYAIKAAKQNPKNAQLQMLASSVLAKQAQYAKARPFAEAVIQLTPNAPAAYTNLGRIYAAENNIEGARKSFRDALTKEPGDANAALSLALVEMAAQQNDAALAVLSEWRKHNSDSIEPRVLEAQLLLSRGKAAEAEKLARETLEKAADNASALAVLARILSSQGRHAEALETFDRAVRAQPTSAPLRYQRALAQRMAGKMDDALASAQEAIRIDARYAPALQLYGVLSVAKGNLEAANSQAEALLKIAPDQASTHELIAMIRSAQNRFEDAARAYRKAGELSPQPLFAIGEFDARMRGKLASPEEPLERFLAAHPKEPSVRIALAMAQQSRGDRTNAARSYEEVLSNYPKSPIALNNLAWMRYEDGKPDAVDLARRAYEVAPEAPAIADTYAWILLHSGKAKEAVKLLEPFMGATGKDTGMTTPDIRAHYAVALARAGRSAEAKVLAKELTSDGAPKLSADLHAMVAELAKT